MSNEDKVYDMMCCQCVMEKYCHENADCCDKFLEILEALDNNED